MGAAASSITSPEDDVTTISTGTGLGDLPEGCIGEILYNLSPPEICQMASVSKAFTGASSADPIWEKKLPGNYRQLMEKSTKENQDQGRLDMGCKMEIYKKLCGVNGFDGGDKEFWLEKSKGGVCIAISSKAMSIIGIHDRRHWNSTPTDESRFHTVAYLQQIWWFEVGGEIEFHFPAGTYSLFFRLYLGRATSKQTGRRLAGPENIHGWDKKPVQFQLSTADGQQANFQCILDTPGSWIHYHVGDFVVQNSDVPTTVKFSMKQIDCTHSKGGLSIDSVLVYPKGFRPW